jgi:hypothetical protein
VRPFHQALDDADDSRALGDQCPSFAIFANGIWRPNAAFGKKLVIGVAGATSRKKVLGRVRGVGLAEALANTTRKADHRAASRRLPLEAPNRVDRASSSGARPLDIVVACRRRRWPPHRALHSAIAYAPKHVKI